MSMNTSNPDLTISPRSSSPRHLSPRHLSPARRIGPFVLAGMLIGLVGWQIAGAQPGSDGSRAPAMVSQAGTFTVLSVAGTGDDLLIALDGQSEQILIYRPSTRGGIELLQRASLPAVFRDAQARATGRP